MYTTSTSILVVVFWIISGYAQSPSQPTQLNLLHRSGQTFITWTERPELTGEKYRIYRHSQPITAQILNQATFLYAVSEGSCRFYADRYNQDSSGSWRARYLERFVISDFGVQLADGTGLLVWTLNLQDFGGLLSGTGYYAVTTVSATGVENRETFSSDNSSGPLTEQVQDPLPVEVLTGAGGQAHIFTQFMDLRKWNPTFHAPNSTNTFYGLSSDDPVVTDSLQYAYTYSVGEPDPTNCGAMSEKLPVLVNLHGWGGNSYGPALIPSEYYCALEIRPIDISETWFFGFARHQDYRDSIVPSATDTVVNYTEQRILRMVYDLLRHLVLGSRVDRNRIYVYGHSMGGSGTLALALRYPNVFAAAYASEPMTNYMTSGDGGGVDWRGDVAPKWGTVIQNLPVHLEGPGPWADHLVKFDGTGVWNWQNHQAQIQSRVAENSVPLGFAHGRNDQVIEWTTQGQPVYGAFNAARRCWGGMVTDADHTWLGYAGFPPSLAPDNTLAPFQGLSVVLNETVPGLSNASGDNALPPLTDGGYNQTIEWSASWNPWDGMPVDTPELWGMSFQSSDGIQHLVDVTPRRLQSFVVTSGATYHWENRTIPGDSVITSGEVVADANGLITVTGFQVSGTGNRLRLQRAGTPFTHTPTGTGSLQSTRTPTTTHTVFSTETPTPTVLPQNTSTPTRSLTVTPTFLSSARRPLPDTSNGIHVFNDQFSNQLTTEQIAFCATHYDGTQKMSRYDADRLRAVNPNFVILHYRLGLGLGYRSTNDSCVPNGEYLHIINSDWVPEWPGDANVQNSWFYLWQGQRVLNCPYGWYVVDLDDVSWRGYWMGEVLTQLANNDNDGLFADSFSVPNYLGGDSYHPPLPGYDLIFESEWENRIEAFISFVKGRFGERYYFIPNVGDWITSRDHVDYTGADGVMIEGFGYNVWETYGETDWQLEMNRILTLVSRGKCVIAQSYRTETPATRLFEVGSYLLIKGNRTYLNLDVDLEPEWWPEYQIPIGSPLSDPPSQINELFQAVNGVYSRSFTNGRVLLNTGDTTRVVQLEHIQYLAQPTGGGFVPENGVIPSEWSINYQPVNQVTLNSGRAAILLNNPNPVATPTATPTEAATTISIWNLF